jgi:hypothetical protein
VAVDYVGDEKAGFCTEPDLNAAVVRVRGWGFWSAELGVTFGGKVLAACRTMPQGTMLLDFSDLKPMRDEGQESLRSVFAALPRFRFSMASRNHLVKLQCLRLATEGGVKNIEFVEKI